MSGSGGRLRAATQVFHNGELWAIGRDLLVDNEYGKLVPVKLLEAAYWETLTGVSISCRPNWAFSRRIPWSSALQGRMRRTRMPANFYQ